MAAAKGDSTRRSMHSSSNVPAASSSSASAHSSGWASSMCNVKVIVRCRPFVPKELADKSNHRIVESRPHTKEVVVLQKYQKTYSFDAVCSPLTTQEELFNKYIIPIIDEVLLGFNCTIFAYGQTGTGKTHTMEGDEHIYLRMKRDKQLNLISQINKASLQHTPKLLKGASENSCLNSMGVSPDLFIPPSSTSSQPSPTVNSSQTLKGGEGGEVEVDEEEDSDIVDKITSADGDGIGPEAGITPRAIHRIFEELQRMNTEYSVRVSYLEIYNEELRDLLNERDQLKLRMYDEHNDGGRRGLAVDKLEEFPVNNPKDIFTILSSAVTRRHMAATRMNQRSSRSHCIFTITIHMKESNINGEEVIKIGKLNLVDLAGSENIQRSGANAVPSRKKEAGMINQSLLTLGRVINALVDNSPYIPYRDSKLTRLLQDSLGGRTKTCIVSTISPSSLCFEETLSTLDYAFRAKNIRNKPEINQKMTKRVMIRELNEEIERLKLELLSAREKNGVYLPYERYKDWEKKTKSQTVEINELISSVSAKDKELTDSKKKVADVYFELSLLQEAHEDSKKKLEAAEQTLEKNEAKIQFMSSRLEEEEFAARSFEDIAKAMKAKNDKFTDHIKGSLGGVKDLVKRLDYRNKAEAEKLEDFAMLTGHLQETLKVYSEDEAFTHLKGSALAALSGISQELDERLTSFPNIIETEFNVLYDTIRGCNEKILKEASDAYLGFEQFKLEDEVEGKEANVYKRCEDIKSMISKIFSNMKQILEDSKRNQKESFEALKSSVASIFEGWKERFSKVEEAILSLKNLYERSIQENLGSLDKTKAVIHDFKALQNRMLSEASKSLMDKVSLLIGSYRGHLEKHLLAGTDGIISEMHETVTKFGKNSSDISSLFQGIQKDNAVIKEEVFLSEEAHLKGIESRQEEGISKYLSHEDEFHTHHEACSKEAGEYATSLSLWLEEITSEKAALKKSLADKFYSFLSETVEEKGSTLNKAVELSLGKFDGFHSERLAPTADKLMKNVQRVGEAVLQYEDTRCTHIEKSNKILGDLQLDSSKQATSEYSLTDKLPAEYLDETGSLLESPKIAQILEDEISMKSRDDLRKEFLSSNLQATSSNGEPCTPRLFSYSPLQLPPSAFPHTMHRRRSSTRDAGSHVFAASTPLWGSATPTASPGRSTHTHSRGKRESRLSATQASQSVILSQVRRQSSIVKGGILAERRSTTPSQGEVFGSRHTTPSFYPSSNMVWKLPGSSGGDANFALQSPGAWGRSVVTNGRRRCGGVFEGGVADSQEGVADSRGGVADSRGGVCDSPVSASGFQGGVADSQGGLFNSQEDVCGSDNGVTPSQTSVSGSPEDLGDSQTSVCENSPTNVSNFKREEHLLIAGTPAIALSNNCEGKGMCSTKRATETHTHTHEEAESKPQCKPEDLPQDKRLNSEKDDVYPSSVQRVDEGKPTFLAESEGIMSEKPNVEQLEFRNERFSTRTHQSRSEDGRKLLSFRGLPSPVHFGEAYAKGSPMQSSFRRLQPSGGRGGALGGLHTHQASRTWMNRRNAAPSPDLASYRLAKRRKNASPSLSPCKLAERGGGGGFFAASRGVGELSKEGGETTGGTKANGYKQSKEEGLK